MSLPAGLAYLLTAAPHLPALAAAASIVRGVLAGPIERRRLWDRAAAALDRFNPRRLSAALLATGFLLATASMPSERWNALAFGGDEPKYLRLADSLLQDLDVDVASRSEGPLTCSRAWRNIKSLGRATVDETRRLGTAVPVPPDHGFNLGNWTLAGIHGGRYYVQSPGLPILLLPGLVVQPFLAPDGLPTFLPLLTLCALFAIGFWQSTLLAIEVSGSRLSGTLAGTMLGLSAPCLIGGFHFYPESAAFALVPWLLRRSLPSSPAVSLAVAAAVGAGIGFLPWLHPKFSLLALVVLVSCLARTRTRAAIAALVASAGVPVAALLLFDRHVTGLLRPDALYARYASTIYSGLGAFLEPMLADGLITGLFGARDGLLILSPVLIGGALAVPLLVKKAAPTAAVLLSAFVALWIAAAVHEGGAPGPPGRLLAPVACVLAASLAVGLRDLRGRLGFSWTVAALGFLTLMISAGMFEDWRRTVNPYRGMFADASLDFAKDLPDGPGRTSDAPLPVHKQRDRLRGVVLLGALAFWAWRFSVVSEPRSAWRGLVLWHAGFWTTLALVATALTALGP